MAASKKTIQAVEEMKAVFGDKEFTEREWDNAGAGVRLGTAVANGLAERIKHTTRTFYTLREIVDELNSCSGEDCYGGSWHYEIDSEGRVYEDTYSYTYRLR